MNDAATDAATEPASVGNRPSTKPVISEEELLRGDLTPLIRSAARAARFMARAFTRVRIEGDVDAIPRDGPVILTSAGGFASSVGQGSYAPAANQLLLVRVSGADSAGVGGTLALVQNPEGMFGELRRAGAAITRLYERRARRSPGGAEPVPVAGGQE